MTTESKPSLLKDETSGQVKQVLALQEQRVRVLAEFEIKFKEYLLDAPNFNHNKLKLLCKNVSEDMNDLSMRILAVKKTFSPDCFNLPELYKLVDQLQSLEQHKFKLERLEKLAHTDEFEIELNYKLGNIRKEINETKVGIIECLEELRYETYADE